MARMAGRGMVAARGRYAALPLVAGLGWVAAVASAHAGEGAIEMRGRGVQVYRCEPTAVAGFGWRLEGPEAVLYDAAGARIGTHFAGPTWQANDGSSVVGETVASSAAPEANAVPWLVLRARSHAGAGAFASTRFIARVRTAGGAAPLHGCDAGHDGLESRIPYSATYMLFRQAGAAP